MKTINVQCSPDGENFITTTSDKTLKDAEKTLLQLEWIEPHMAWRAVVMKDGEIASLGKTDYSEPKSKVIWTKT
jgi:hypothetical protein